MVDNKKGQFVSPFLGIGIIAVIILIVIAFVSVNFRIYAIGLSFLIGSALVYSRSDLIRKEQTRVLLALVMGLVGVFLFLAPGTVLQSVISSDQITTIDGETYWVFTGVQIGETEQGVRFKASPESVTLNDGTQLDPQRNVNVYIAKEEGYCQYALQRNDVSYYNIYSKQTLTYYTLSSFERNAIMSVTDGYGQYEEFDATTNNGVTITSQFGDLRVQPLGLLATKTDCETGQDVAILQSGQVVRRSDLVSSVEDCSTFNSGCFLSVNQNNEFIESFDSNPVIDFNAKTLKGDKDIGNGVFTVSGSADYFDAIEFIPETVADPRITDVDYNNQVGEDSSQGVEVFFRNDGDNGDIVINVLNPDSVSFTRNSLTRSLQGGESDSVTFKSSYGFEGDFSATFQVCGVSQFEEVNCDTEEISGTIISIEEAEEVASCGDGVCSSNEDSNVCAVDCFIPESREDQRTPVTPSTCAWYEQEVIVASSSLTDDIVRGVTFGLIDPQPDVTEKCVLASWVVPVLFLGVFVIMFIVIVFGMRKPRRKK